MNTHAAIHVARKQLGMDDDTARDLYERVTGKRSLRAMSEPERNQVVAEFRKRGFKAASNGRKKLTGKYAAKLQALWIAGYNLGIVRNRDDAALIAFVKRQSGLDHVRFLQSAADARSAVEALKSWLTREGGVDWSEHQFDPPYALTPGFKIAWAQWRKLGGTVHANSTHQFWKAVADTIGRDIDFETEPTDKQWITVMNAFGKRIRAL